MVGLSMAVSRLWGKVLSRLGLDDPLPSLGVGEPVLMRV